MRRFFDNLGVYVKLILKTPILFFSVLFSYVVHLHIKKCAKRAKRLKIRKILRNHALNI